MLRKPPDVLITTPESLYLMLTSQARAMFASATAVIVDEIHAVARTKRGAHLALTLERLEHAADDTVQRIGLSATQNPLEEVGRFLVGTGRECQVVDTGVRKPLDLKIHVPVEDMREPGAHDVTDPAVGGQGTAAGGGDLMGVGPGEPEDAATRRSIWPAIYPELLKLVQEHRSTIIFVNNRRGAERLAVRLNELAGDEDKPAEIARAHHGSLAREERLVVEDLLKSGDLPCLVATSSLELGIDMGAVDLVLQVESPKSVTAGLQRIGRAGHNVGDTSKGRIFPKFRADLLECAVVAKRMREGLIETTVIPRNPLDVLAQQVVAVVATGDDWKAGELHELVRRAYPYSDLSRELFDQVLDMLDGRYPSEEFSELRPRIVWDRVEDTIRARKGARQLAVTNAGTIPDRGLYGVHLPDGRRVGELDEEMVYEARPGQTFMLGASTWRIEEITRDRVIVTPAPGAPGALPYWKGDGVGRPAELGKAIGQFSRTVDRPRAGEAGGGVRPGRPRRRQPGDLPARAARGHPGRAQRPDDRGRALPRRDRRLAPVRALALRRPRARRVGAGAERPHPRPLRPRVRRHLVGRRDHRPPARRRRAARRRAGAGRARRGRGAGGRRAGGLRAVRRPLPRERRAGAAAAARLPGQAHAAVAAAAEGAVAAGGGQEVRPVPDRARDLPRVPARRARPARASRSCCAGCTRASSAWSRPRPSARPRSPARCCSTTWPRTCTRATRPTRSAAPPR